VVVHDRHDNPITGLTKNDFIILDNKKQQAIQVFLTRTSKPRGHSAAPLPPDTYSNRMADLSSPMSATVILLDGLNTKISDQQYAREQVLKFLEQIQPQDRVALYTLGTDLKLLHDFTSDATSLLRALHSYAGQISPSLDESRPSQGYAANNQHSLLDNPDEDILGPFLSSIGSAEEIFLVEDRIWRTIDALKQIGNHVALLPGRKNLIWVSGSFLPAANLQDVEMNTPDGGLLFTAGIDSMARALNNASLVVYPVDARGLLTSLGRFGHPDTTEFAAMDVIAQRTGGKASYNTNDIFGAIREAIDDSLVSYELGYYPVSGNWDGSFHKIQIKVQRPGASARTREGYFAVRDPKMTPAVRQSLIAGAITNLLETDGIGMTVRVNAPKAESKTDRRLSMSVVLDPEDLSVELKDGRWTGALDTMLVQLDDKSTVLSATDDAFQFHLTPDKYQQMTRNGLSYKEDIAVQTGASELRVVVRDASSGKVGAASIPLTQYIPASKTAN
jgi:VWFA-related protein